MPNTGERLHVVEIDGTDAGASTLMYAEARDSALAVERLLANNAETVARLTARFRSSPPNWITTVARGSSDNACTYGRYLIENGAGIVCASVGLSVGSLYNAPSAGTNGLCIAVSQSGASPDLLATVSRAKAGGAFIVGCVNQPGSPLSELCDEVIELSAGAERSVAATKSFISSMAAFAWLAAEWTNDDDLRKAVHSLPDLLSQAWDKDWTAVENALHKASNLYVLGRGPGLGAAQELALKLKETCGLHAEAFSSAEVIHGPMALVGEGFPIIGLAQSDASYSTSCATAESLAARGATVLFAGGVAGGTTPLATVDAHPSVQPILMTQSFYRSAANLSVLRGYDPDNPPHLAKVTRTY